MKQIVFLGSKEQLEDGKYNVAKSIYLEIANLANVGIKNFQVIDGAFDKGGLKCNLPTNKTKANRLVVELNNEDTYNMYLSSEWQDKTNNVLICNKKFSMENLRLEDILKQFIISTDIKIQPFHINSVNLSSEETEAERLGKEAYLAHLERKPISDIKLVKKIESLGLMTNEKAFIRNGWIREWFDGYDKEKNKSNRIIESVEYAS